jgi:5,5'-dehydrodivanillate O-demethylase
MLTPAENERLTRVGPGTPMGGLLRRYWHPVATAGELADRWTKRVRLLGEDLVLYRDRTGRFGLIAESCPHRRASMAYGIPTDDGIRCPYHGWKFDGTGACLEQPNEPAGSSFRDKVTTPAYPVAELGGLLWAYLGPAPAPQIPRLDGFLAPGAIRSVGQCVIPCNWLQIMENSLDPMHAEWLHGHYAEFLREKDGTKFPLSRRTVKIAFDEVPVGIAKRRLLEGQSEDCDDWTIGHPVIFPTTLAIGSANPTWMQYSFQIRVPVDDTHTLHYWYDAFVPPADSHPPARLFEGVHLYDAPYLDARGEYLVDYIYGQDIMVWLKQGPIADRSRESLGASDRGITLYRRMLARELERVASGEDPKCVVRDPARDAIVEVPIERHMNARSDGFARFQRRHVLSFSPIFEELVALFDRAPEPVAAGRS